MTFDRLDLGVYMGHETVRDGVGVREIARTGEEIGLRYLWCSEHVVVPVAYESRYPFTEDGVPRFRHDGSWGTSLVLLGHAAAVTEKIRLATSVIPMTCHHPVALAKDAATVDCLSGGRLELGIGSGWLAEEAEILELPTRNRGPRLFEAIEIMRGAWGESPFSFDGQHYTIPACHVRPAPVQGTEIPIWIGGLGKSSLEAVVRYGQGLALPRSMSGRVAEMRELIGEEKRIAVGVKLEPGFDPGEARASIGALAAAGADEVHLVCGESAAEVVSVLRRFERLVLAR